MRLKDIVNESIMLSEKQFKGLEGIPANKSLEKISNAEKLNIIKAKGNIINFIVPAGMNINFWQVISTGSIKKSSSGNIVMLMGQGPMNSPSFKTIDDLIDGVDWKAMEQRRRFNEGVAEAKEIKWQDVEVGDSANVTATNKTGVIVKTYGRKFHLKFVDGTTKTFDANELSFVKQEGVNESELKGYLAADVVDDIVKSIGSKFVKGYIENAPNKNYIYLKLTDIKFGNDVVKMLKSKFGIDAKIDKTFGNIPSVSFASKKVISESVNESLSSDIKNAKNLLKDPHTITDIQYKQTRRGDKYIQINYKKNYVAGKMYDPEGQFVSIFYEDDKDLTLIGKELKLKLKESVKEKSDDVFADYSSSKGKTKGRSFSVDRVVKDGKYSFESDDNDGTVRLLYNGKPISYGFIDWSTGGFIMIHSSWNNKDKSFQFTKDIIQYFKSKRITTETVTEAKVKTPTEILTSVPATAIPPTNIPRADVMLGLHMGGVLGSSTLTVRDYSLGYSNGKVALKLTRNGIMAVRVRSEKNPDYVNQIKKVADKYLMDYAKEIKK